jgi:hypothetical protein
MEGDFGMVAPESRRHDGNGIALYYAGLTGFSIPA